MTIISVSAQFGGLDAGEAVLPHFRALKSALKGRSFAGFPLPKLAFILRVDGAISGYGLSGPGNIDFDRRGQWVSVDIGITAADWSGREVSEVAAFVARAIVASVDLLKDARSRRLERADWDAVRTELRACAAAYTASLSASITAQS